MGENIDAAQIVAQLRTQGFQLRLKDGELYVQPRAKLSQEMKAQIGRIKSQIILELNKEAWKAVDPIKRKIVVERLWREEYLTRLVALLNRQENIDEIAILRQVGECINYPCPHVGIECAGDIAKFEDCVDGPWSRCLDGDISLDELRSACEQVMVLAESFMDASIAAQNNETEELWNAI